MIELIDLPAITALEIGCISRQAFRILGYGYGTSEQSAGNYRTPPPLCHCLKALLLASQLQALALARPTSFSQCFVYVQIDPPGHAARLSVSDSRLYSTAL